MKTNNNTKISFLFSLFYFPELFHSYENQPLNSWIFKRRSIFSRDNRMNCYRDRGLSDAAWSVTRQNTNEEINKRMLRLYARSETRILIIKSWIKVGILLFDWNLISQIKRFRLYIFDLVFFFFVLVSALETFITIVCRSCYLIFFSLSLSRQTLH